MNCTFFNPSANYIFTLDLTICFFTVTAKTYIFAFIHVRWKTVIILHNVRKSKNMEIGRNVFSCVV
jgi:hypothetical protein